jgi:Leucine-rich repeat (LRR) protein
MLEGSLPTELGKASNLTLLYIDDNMLTGDPTSTLTKLTQATQLFANDNKFTGAITSSFMNASFVLNYLDLSSNGFTSTEGIPTHLFALRQLDVLDLSNNNLGGPISNDIASNNELKIIAAYNNKLSGTIPTTLQNLGLLSHLDISNNTFTGDMPDFIGTMNQLRVLFLSENSFKAGTIPASYGNLKKLNEFSIRNTQRNGKLPDFLGQLTLLDILDIGNNELTGTIPATFGDLSLLSFLLLNDNLVTGPVPGSLSKLSDLKAAYFDGTRLSGDLAALCDLPHFADTKADTGERIVADCLSTEKDGAEITCSCCRCCPAQQQGGCSDPDLANLDVKWEDTFRRQTSKAIDFGGENETVAVTGDDILQSE